MSKKSMRNVKGPVFLSAKSDIIFKLFFGDKRNLDFLVRFLQSVLKLPLEDYADIQITDPQTKREYKDDKLAILDVKVITSTGKIINIEIQVYVTPEMRERIILYDAKMITEQISIGEGYDVIKKVISIVITGETLIPEHDRYHDRFTFYSPETKTEFTDLIEIHTLELPKLPDEPDGTDLWSWLAFIDADNEEALTVLAQKDPEMKDPIEKLIALNQDPTARMLFEAREKQRRDNMSLNKEMERRAMQKGLTEGLQQGLQQGIEQGLQQGIEQGLQQGIEQGLQQGIEQGLQQGIEQGLQQGIEQGLQQGIEQGVQKGLMEGILVVAQKLLIMNFSLDAIAAATGLTIDEVEKLLEDN